MSLNDLLKIERQARKSGNLDKTNHIPSSGSGYGLKNGRRVYYRKGKIAPAPSAVVQDLLIENPTNVAKSVWGGVKNTSNALLGMASPWNLAAMGRTKRNLAAVGRKQGEVNPKNPNLIWDLKSGGWVQNEAVTKQIAKTDADKLRLKGNADKFFGVGKYGDRATQLENLNAGIPENPNLFKGQMLISQGGGNTAILQPGSPGSNLNRDTYSNQGTDKNDVVGTPHSNSLKVNSAIPLAAVENETKNRKSLKSNVFTRHYKTGKELGVMTRNQRKAYEKEAAGRVWEGGGGTRWVGANSTWVDRNNNVIAPQEP